VGAVRFPGCVVPFCLLLTGCGLVAGAASDRTPTVCVAPAQWAVPRSGGPAAVAADRALTGLAQQQAVLLGETHDDAEHHRWQLHTISGIYALRSNIVLGFEMFPRRVQPVLDEWVAGRLGDSEFLTRVEWQRVWGYDFHLYLPIFQFARVHRIPMVALNVERRFVSRVRDEGWAAIPVREREGISDPAPADREYANQLYQSYLDHQSPGGRHPAQRKPPSEEEFADAKFRRFVEAMQVWDRAMAQGIAERVRGDSPPLVLAIMGSGHLRHGHGVPRQLRDLGVSRIGLALPWGPSDSCMELTPGVADVVFGVEARPQPARPDHPRLGISIETAALGVRVRDVASTLNVETVNGDIDIEESLSDSVEASSVNGLVRFLGAIRAGGRYRLATHNGDIVVVVPDHTNAAFDISTFNGEFETSIPVRLSELRRGQRFKFVLGEGGAEFDLESFQGAIVICRPSEPCSHKEEE